LSARTRAVLLLLQGVAIAVGIWVGAEVWHSVS
jgi:hypothetical protein